jgi:hypothetical protein
MAWKTVFTALSIAPLEAKYQSPKQLQGNSCTAVILRKASLRDLAIHKGLGPIPNPLFESTVDFTVDHAAENAQDGQGLRNHPVVIYNRAKFYQVGFTAVGDN